MTKRRHILPLAALLALALPVLAACAGRINTPEGWSAGVVNDDTLYIGTRQGDVRAIDAASGATRGRFRLLGQDDQFRGVYGAPAFHNGSLYIGGYDSVLYALSETLELKWQEPVGGPIVGSPTVAGDAVIVGADDGGVYAINLEDQSRRWVFRADNKVWSSPVAGDGAVYVSSLDKRIYALDLEDGGKLWQFDSGGAIASTPALDEGTLYVGSFDGIFYAIDAASGEERWRFDGAQRWYWGTPLVHGEDVFAPSLDGNLYALNKRTGRLRWTLRTAGPIVGSPAITPDGLIAVGSYDGRLHIARVSDGNPLDSCNIQTEIRSALTESGGMVFFAAKDQSIRALRVKSDGNPDEEWVHQPNEDDPVARGRVEDC